MPKFQSNTGSPVHLFLPGRPPVLEVDHVTPYETVDEDEVQALRGSPEVNEVREVRGRLGGAKRHEA